MLKPIHRVSCSDALAACQKLMQRLALWLCDVNVHGVDVTVANCRAQMPSTIEGDWLWSLLQRKVDERPLLVRAKYIADLADADKLSLAAWVYSVSAVSAHFVHLPQANLPTDRPINKAAWAEFKFLMLSFYGKGFYQIGLPYLPNGIPIADEGLWLTYHQFVEIFRKRHRLNPDPNSREVCVLCGGPLTQPAVDHWIREGAYPLLSVCADNLLPICGECNEAPNKGQKDVHSSGCFSEWFHPYLRPANGQIQLNYDLHTLSISASANSPVEAQRVAKLDSLLNLSKRWSLEFKSEYIKQQGELKKREQLRKKQGKTSFTQAEIQDHIQTEQDVLLSTEPHHEVHSRLFSAILEQARLASWQVELGLQ